MGEKYATLKDVAKLAGTTAPTVSYVLSGKEGRYISDEMRARVLKAVEETGYVKSSAASSLRGKKRGIIAVLVPQFSNQFFTRMVLAIEAEVEKEGYILSICNTFDDPTREMEIINRMVQHRVDGYILIPTVKGKENTALLRQLDVPIVVPDRPLEGVDNYNWVTTDNYRCGRLAAEHLVQKGHRHLAFIGWNSHIADLDCRRRAFLDVTQEAGIPPEQVTIMQDAFSEAAGYTMTQQLLEDHPDVTAILYAYNVQAEGGVNCLTERGLVPGRDISVILIGSPRWATVGQNCFTHIDQREYELGKCAAQLLLENINHPAHTQKKQEICLAPLLQEGTSVVDLRTEKESLT